MTNTASNLDQAPRTPLKRENEILLTMAKALDKYSPRNYGTVIGIVDGKAYVTDGFSLLRWLPIGHLGDDKTLRADLSESPVKYPGVKAVLPTDAGETINHECFNNLRKFLKSSWKGMPVHLRILNKEVSLVPETRTESISGHLFNPQLFIKNCKGLPKEAVCTGATLHTNGEILKLTFLADVGEFEMILVALRKAP